MGWGRGGYSRGVNTGEKTNWERKIRREKGVKGKERITK